MVESGTWTRTQRLGSTAGTAQEIKPGCTLCCEPGQNGRLYICLLLQTPHVWSPAWRLRGVLSVSSFFLSFLFSLSGWPVWPALPGRGLREYSHCCQCPRQKVGEPGKLALAVRAYDLQTYMHGQQHACGWWQSTKILPSPVSKLKTSVGIY